MKGKKGRGKPKGNEFERDVCKALSLWISGGSRTDIFWRSALSGGRATQAFKSGVKHQTQVGDISAIDPLGQRLIGISIVECKAYNDLNIISGVIKDSGLLYGFWFELLDRCKKFGKAPLLIARQDYVPPLCIMDDFLLKAFGLSMDYASAYLPRWEAYVVLFDCFLREAKVPQAGLRIVEPRRRRVSL